MQYTSRPCDLESTTMINTRIFKTKVKLEPKSQNEKFPNFLRVSLLGSGITWLLKAAAIIRICIFMRHLEGE